MKKLISVFLLCLSVSLFSFEPVILLFGPPGSGKGTFSQMAKEQGYIHLSAGDVIRDEIAQKTPFGLMVESIVKKGEYVDRLIFSQMIMNKITQLSKEGKPLIIDGFARCPEDMQDLVNTLSNLQLKDSTFVLFFDAADEVCKDRISGRVICLNCHNVYNTKNHDIYAGRDCPNCKEGVLEERINDTRFVIDKRMKDYRENIEKSYRLSLNFFPALFFDSGQESEVCLKFYEHLLSQIETHQGNSKDFVLEFAQ